MQASDRSMNAREAGSFGGFVSSLLPLMALVALGLAGLHLSGEDMPIIGAILLTLLSAIPLSIGPLFLMLVAYAMGKASLMLSLASAFNHLRFKLVLPVFILILCWMGGWLPVLPMAFWIGLAVLYFLICLWFTTRLVRCYLPLSPLLGSAIAAGALCLAIL